MSHLLYELADESDHTVYRLLQDKIGLTAKSGIIASFVNEARGSQPGGWRMDESNLLNRFGGDPETRAIVVDLKPNRTDIVNLYRMRGIIGYSHIDWTPICFLLEEMFGDEPVEDPQGFKQRFALSSFKRKAISFVYLRRGTQGGAAWNWGHVGRVNGAILFPEAWQHFAKELSSSGWLEADPA